MQASKLIASSALAAALLVVLLALARPIAGANNQQEEPLQAGHDGSLFLAGTECGPNEQLAPGSLPTCEPTCENPRPVCPKMFFAGLDYVPCFCKSPLVRNVRTKQCVTLGECPKARQR